MQPLKQLIARAARLTVSQPILWTPPLGIALLSSLMAPQATPQMGIIFLVTALITLAVTAGWYALIAKAASDELPVWEDFFVAIGRHFSTLIGGTIVFGLLVAVVAVPLLMAAVSWAGPESLNKLKDLLPGLMQQAQTKPEVLLSIEPSLLLAANRFFLGLCGAGLWFALLSMVLLFWKQAVVLGTMPWPEAWKASLTVMRRHFGPAMGVMTVHGLAYLAAAFFSLMPLPFGLIGWLLLIGVDVFATVAYTLLYLEAIPPVKTAESASATPTGQAG
ncbi:hypothetical protein J7643_07590 [bacterium]|nr:hypothetical protein [bacterium]